VTNSAIDALYILAFGQLWFRVPESVKVELNGKLPAWCVGKDVILKVAADLGTDFGLYKSVEYVGPVARQMTLAQRWTSPAGVEVGAKFALFEADDKSMSSCADASPPVRHLFPDAPPRPPVGPPGPVPRSQAWAPSSGAQSPRSQRSA
jgi:3-isopropylmalate/(R)-2-methylmalate dehydratase large subunit